MSAYNVCRVVNGRIVSARMVKETGGGTDVDYYDHKMGRKSRTRYLRRSLQAAESLGQLPNRIAQHVGRRRPTAA